MAWTFSVLGQGEVGQASRTGLRPVAKSFSLKKEKWGKEINVSVLEKSLPHGRAEGFLVGSSSWEGQTQLVAAQGAQRPVCF